MTTQARLDRLERLAAQNLAATLKVLERLPRRWRDDADLAAGIDKTIIRDETSTASGDEPFDMKE